MTNETRADLGFAAVAGPAKRTGVWDGLPAVTAIEDALSFIAHACDRAGLNPVETFCDGLKTYRDDCALRARVTPMATGDCLSMADIAAVHDPVGDMIAEHDTAKETT